MSFWWRALRTVQMVAMQAERFDIALQQLELAERDAADRASLNATTELNLAIRANRDAQPFARRPVRIPTWALDWMVRTELHLLVVSLRDLFRAIDGLPKDKRPRLIHQHQLTAAQSDRALGGGARILHHQVAGSVSRVTSRLDHLQHA